MKKGTLVEWICNDIFYGRPTDHPDHHTVGRYFAGFGRGTGDQTEIFFCDAYDPRMGYWMSDTKPTGARTNISERAPGRTWHEAQKLADHWWISGWGLRVPFQTV